MRTVTFLPSSTLYKPQKKAFGLSSFWLLLLLQTNFCISLYIPQQDGNTDSAGAVDKTNSKMPLLYPGIRHKVAQCACGKVKLSIDAVDPLRLVCYCKDCRGYYNTLYNEHCSQNHKNDAQQLLSPQLDAWGGADYIHMYPSEIKITEGKEHIAVGKIRDKSPINRFYTTCCHTPLFSIGSTKTVLLNTNLLMDFTKNENQEKNGSSTNIDMQLPEIRFRIIGRDALEGDEKNDRPKMSWSVPFAWFWVMPRRIRNDLVAPMPIDIPDKVDVLKNFKEG